MADYYVILKRAVEGLPDGSRERRQAVYDKARKALLAKLQNMEPPLAPSDISKQRMALEEAVRAVERDLSLEKQKQEASGASSDEDTSKRHVDPVPMPAEDQPSGSSASGKSGAGAPSVTVTSSKSSAVPVAETGGRLSNVDLPSNDDNKNAPSDGATFSESDRVVRRAGQDVLKNAVRDANVLGAATNAAVKSARDAAEAVGEERNSDTPRIEPTLGDVVMSQSKTYHRPEMPVEAGKKVVKDDSSFDDDGTKSRFGLIAGLLLGAGVLGGSGYLLYQNLGTIEGSDTQNDGVVTQRPQASDTGAASGQSTSSQGELTGKQVRTVTVKPPESDVSPADLPAGAQDDAATPEVTASQDDTTQEAIADPTQNEAAGEQSQVVDGVDAAQQSILYEEEGPNGEPGSATAGQVLWALDGDGDDASVIASVEIPGKQITFDIKISKNADKELPASHLIEISATREEMDPERAITNIPGLILKPTEQSRGEGLIGAAIRIADDLHWIALTAGERETRYNLELLSLRSWIDIPIQYNSGRRAILTLEKGAAGDQVISEAIAAWGE